ncbi:putative transporter small subunit [Halomonas sp. M20]|nr:putative transporter small subunit [Halomonas sp. M20]
MQTLIYGTYILIWPTITLAVLLLICSAVRKDIRAAKREKRDLV